MSEITNVLQTGSQLITNYDTTKIFLGGNRFKTGSLKNTTGSELTLTAGTLLGRVDAIAVDTDNVVGYLTPHLSTNTEGNEIVGVLAQDLTLADNAVATEVSYCIAGDVSQGDIVLGSGDTLATILNGLTIADNIVKNTGIILVVQKQLTATDNQ